MNLTPIDPRTWGESKAGRGIANYRAVFSFGGGVQSHAALLLTAQGKLDYDAFIFANVGAKAESPHTLAYLQEHTIPFCEKHGIPFHVIQRTRQASNARLGLKAGDVEDLYEQITREGTRSIQIPVRMANGAPGNRNCTQTFKIEVIDRFLRNYGAASEARPVRVGVGITTDEIGRMRTDQPNPTQLREYPLIAARLTRRDCHAINESGGFHNVPRSACWFCPLKSIPEWLEMADDDPEQYAQLTPLEAALNRKREAMGRDPVYFNSRRVPMAQLKALPLFDAFDELGCDTGHCMT